MKDYLENFPTIIPFHPCFIPSKQDKKTKERLSTEIINALAAGVSEKAVNIEGNRLSIKIYEGTRNSGKKIIGAVSNRYSTANIHENAKDLLMDRISSKAAKCGKMLNVSEYWLAL